MNKPPAIQPVLIRHKTIEEDGIKLWSSISGPLNDNGKTLIVSIEEYKRNRSIEANRLQRKWLNEAQDQGDMTQEEYRGYCKLHFGIEIAKEKKVFAEKYDRLLKPFTYEEKMEFMMVPFDMPVTRTFDTNQMHRYLNKMYEHFTGLGFVLTLPVDKYWTKVFDRWIGL